MGSWLQAVVEGMPFLLPDSAKPEADGWVKVEDWNRRMSTGVMFVVFGILISAVFVWGLVSHAFIGGGLNPASLMLVAIATFMVIVGSFAIKVNWQSPREIGTSDQFLYFVGAKTLVTVPYPEVVAVHQPDSRWTGPTLEFALRDGRVVRVGMMSANTLEGLVTQVERRLPWLAPLSRWSFTTMSDGTLHRDEHFAEGLGSKFDLEPGGWRTPTASLAPLLSLDPHQAKLFFLFFFPPPFIAMAAVAAFLDGEWPTFSVAVAAIVVLGFLARRSFRKMRPKRGTYGVSQLRVAGAIHSYERVVEAVQASINDLGIGLSKDTRRDRVWGRSRQWVLDVPVRVELRTSPSEPITIVTVVTTGERNAPAHQRFKGAVLGRLQLDSSVSAYVPVADPVAPTSETSNLDDARAPWQRAVLLDGSWIPDAPYAASRSIQSGPTAAWMSRSRELDKKLVRALAGLAVAAVGGVAVVAFANANNLSAPLLTAGVIFLSVLVPAIAARLFPELRGTAAQAILNLGEVYRRGEDVAPSVERVLSRLGIPVDSHRQGTFWWTWKLRGPMTLRYTAPTGDLQARVYLRARGWQTQHTFTRLKGLLLEELGLASRRPVAAVGGRDERVFVAPSGTPASHAPGPTVRDQPPHSLVAPPPWAYSEWPGMACALPDGEFPAGGPAAAPAGWWMSSPKPIRGSRMERAAFMIASAIFGVPVAVVFVFVLLAVPGAAPQITLAIATSLILLLSVALWSTFRSWRKRARKEWERHIYSVMVMPAGSWRVSDLAAEVGQACVAAIPTLAPTRPADGAAATWVDDLGTFHVNLFDPSGKRPFLELRGIRPAPQVTRLKGAITTALFG